MALDEQLLREARQARDRLIGLQREAELAQVRYQHAIRRLHAAGGSLRQIADALGLSYQRVHQVVNVTSGKGAVKECQVDAFCSFCETHSSEVRSLVAGPGVFICDRCVRLVRDVLVERQEPENYRTRLRVTDCAEPTARCSFCGKKRNRVKAMVEAPDQPIARKFAHRAGRTRICDKCLALCEEILREGLRA